jgi:hypothetical protein
MKIKKIILPLLLFISTSIISYAEYIGPIPVIEGRWGSGDFDFGFESGDTMDSFPGIIVIDSAGKIFIGDGVNERVKIYNITGKWQSNFTPKEIKIPFGGWPANLKVKSSIGIFSIYKKLQKYDYKGNLIWAIEVPGTRDYWVMDDGSIILQDIQKNYHHYSSTGQLLKTYDTRPLKLGLVQENSIGGGNYETTIEYSDKKWKVKGLCAKYMRDACGILYCVDNAIVIRYDDEGKDEAFIGMPNEKTEEIKAPPNLPAGIDSPVNVLEQYGSPVLAPNGDVYTWKRTPDKYSILKWVWADGPECPQYLEVKPTANSLKFTWQKPTKDADKITYYQLLQSFNICGPFRQTALIKKDQLNYEDRDVKKGETYYYIVKAIRGKDYSGNSNKVCGQIE